MALFHVVYPIPIEKDFTIDFSLETSSDVIFDCFSIDGKKIASFGKYYFPKGENSKVFTLPENLSKGVYILHLQTSTTKQYKKIVVR